MKRKELGLRVAGIIFAVITIAHLLRLITAVSMFIANWAVPFWVSAVALVVTGSLSAWLWRLSFVKDRI